VDIVKSIDESKLQRRVGRLAPSPTGRMHIGNVYAALAAWLDVRAVNGTLSLRIEDIDTYRVVPDADSWIMEDLDWLGLHWDNTVVYQSQRLNLYDAVFQYFQQQTLLSGEPLIYPCFCSRADIRAASAPNEGDGFSVYPGTCRHLDNAERQRRLVSGARHSWRIAVPMSPSDTQDVVIFADKIFGAQRFSLSKQLGDVIIRRSDGVYAYQFATAVDDWQMGVNTIVRGRDLLRSTAIQLWIREHCEGVNLQEFSSPATPAREVIAAHLPLIDGADGRRMAKRFASLDMQELRNAGRRPSEVIGLCAHLLGLTTSYKPTRAKDLLEAFSFSYLRNHQQDRKLSNAWGIDV
jgi:glutamyl-tRNA synthetase